MTIVLMAAAVMAGAALAQSREVPFDADRWIVSDRNFKLTQTEDTSRNGERLEYRGKKALRVSKGLFYARDVDFANGTIDVDMTSETGRFLGLAFHIKSDDNYELVFFRPRTILAQQNIQYTPVFLGAPAWQIFHGPGYTAAAKFAPGEWTHVRLVISGTIAKVYLHDAAEPAMVIPDLRLGNEHGSIGFWGHMGDAFYANLRYTPDTSAAPPPAPPKFLPGALTNWELSNVYDVAGRDVAAAPDTRALKWEKAAAEPPGMVLINRYRRSPNVLPPDRDEQLAGATTGSQFVYARTVIQSDRDQVRRMNIGFSDQAVVFLNGRPLYAGSNVMSFRQPESLGLLESESESVFLPLKKGANELVLAVSEYFGGWAFLCRLADEPRPRALEIDPAKLELVNSRAEVVDYRGRRAVHLIRTHENDNESLLALMAGREFKNGTIEADIAAMPRPDAPKDMRGFAGVAFRVQPGATRFENIFIRPANGRAQDQLRRNHSTQYESLPEFPWSRLRAESPGVYESYADFDTGEWTHVKIAVSGQRAWLYINGAEQPCLVVQDLKLGDVSGAFGFWAHSTSDAYIASLIVRPE